MNRSRCELVHKLQKLQESEFSKTRRLSQKCHSLSPHSVGAPSTFGYLSFDCLPHVGEEEADGTDCQPDHASPDAIVTIAEVTLRDDDELTESLSDTCLLGLVRVHDESDDSATSAGGESDTRSTTGMNGRGPLSWPG